MQNGCLACWGATNQQRPKVHTHTKSGGFSSRHGTFKWMERLNPMGCLFGAFWKIYQLIFSLDGLHLGPSLCVLRPCWHLESPASCHGGNLGHFFKHCSVRCITMMHILHPLVRKIWCPFPRPWIVAYDVTESSTWITVHSRGSNMCAGCPGQQCAGSCYKCRFRWCRNFIVVGVEFGTCFGLYFLIASNVLNASKFIECVNELVVVYQKLELKIRNWTCVLLLPCCGLGQDSIWMFLLVAKATLWQPFAHVGRRQLTTECALSMLNCCSLQFAETLPNCKS